MDLTDPNRGKRGEPGKTGSPGVDGHGGTGGTGGHGGTGGSVTKAYRGILIFIMVVSIGLMIGTLILVGTVRTTTNIVTANNRKIAKLQAASLVSQAQINADQVQTQLLQDRAIAQSRRSEYRQCVRQMVSRVVINLERPPKKNGLPIYDCRPTLKGEPAVHFTPSQSTNFTRTEIGAHFYP